MSRLAAVAALGVLTLLVAVASCKGCNEDEDPPELPTAEPIDSAPPVELVADDASDGVDGEDAAPKKRAGRSVSRLVSCCRIVASNAAHQGDPMVKGSMIQAASVCESAARSGNYRAVDQTLRQFNIPCQ